MHVPNLPTLSHRLYTLLCICSDVYVQHHRSLTHMFISELFLLSCFSETRFCFIFADSRLSSGHCAHTFHVLCHYSLLLPSWVSSYLPPSPPLPPPSYLHVPMYPCPMSLCRSRLCLVDRRRRRLLVRFLYMCVMCPTCTHHHRHYHHLRPLYCSSVHAHTCIIHCVFTVAFSFLAGSLLTPPLNPPPR